MVAVVGILLGDKEGKLELQVERPEATHAGYTQQERSDKNGVAPNTILLQFCIIMILRELHKVNALEPIDLTLFGIVTEVSTLQL
jgi:hypothetical protein